MTWLDYGAGRQLAVKPERRGPEVKLADVPLGRRGMTYDAWLKTLPRSALADAAELKAWIEAVAEEKRKKEKR